MNFKTFEKKVKAKFPLLNCKETVDRRDNLIFTTTDGSVSYSPADKRWWYSEAKSRSGSGKTLEEAIAKLPSLADEYD